MRFYRLPQWSLGTRLVLIFPEKTSSLDCIWASAHRQTDSPFVRETGAMFDTAPQGTMGVGVSKAGVRMCYDRVQYDIWNYMRT